MSPARIGGVGGGLAGMAAALAAADGGAEVVLFVIKGGVHTWPGRQWPVFWLGKTTRDISANDLMWEFFKKHPMK